VIRAGLSAIPEDRTISKGIVAETFDQEVDEDPRLRRQISRRRIDRGIARSLGVKTLLASSLRRDK
jgi:hypothetical protein